MKLRLGPDLTARLRAASDAFRMGPSEIARRALRKARKTPTPLIDPYKERTSRTNSEAYTLEIPEDLLLDVKPTTLRDVLNWYLTLPQHDPSIAKRKPPIEIDTSPAMYVPPDKYYN